MGWGTIDEPGRATVTMIEDRSGPAQRSEPAREAGGPAVDVKVGAPPIDVRLNYTDLAPMPVGVTRIKPAGDWEPIGQTAEPEPTRPRPGGR